MSPDDRLDADRLRVAVGQRRIGHRLIVLEETTSTNDVVAGLAAASDEGLVVLAERQTSGRGQYGRRWESAAKGLWLSILLRPRIKIAESSRITDFLANTIVGTICESLGLPAEIRPPNDVYIKGRKVAGVLVEMRVERDGAYCAVAGLGINVNHQLADFPVELRDKAGSLASARGEIVNRTDFAIALLHNLDARYSAGQL